jgi:hypothetical protein
MHAIPVVIDNTDSGYSYMTDAEFLTCNNGTDVCIFAQAYDDLIADGAKPVLDQLSCVKNGRVYDNQKQGDNDWFESRFASPDTLLQDLVMALHEDNGFYGIGLHTRVWIRKLSEVETPPAPVCPSGATSPFVSDASACIDVVAASCLAAKGAAAQSVSLSLAAVAALVVAISAVLL